MYTWLKVKKYTRKIFFYQRRADVRVRPCQFHEDVSRFIVAKIVGKTGFLSPMHACTVCTCDAYVWSLTWEEIRKRRTVNWERITHRATYYSFKLRESVCFILILPILKLFPFTYLNVLQSSYNSLTALLKIKLELKNKINLRGNETTSTFRVI